MKVESVLCNSKIHFLIFQVFMDYIPVFLAGLPLNAKKVEGAP